MCITSFGLEITTTPEMLQQLTISCYGDCEGTSDSEEYISELKEKLDTMSWTARNAPDMMPGNQFTIH